MAKPVNADQHEYMPRSFGQRGDGTLDVERRSAARRIGSIGQARHGFGNLILGPQTLAPRQHAIDRDLVQPGGKAAAALEAPQCTPSGNKGLLRTILRSLPLS